jgi:MarR family 2-MHQ and catechol resistance regulon transcriptional repressor
MEVRHRVIIMYGNEEPGTASSSGPTGEPTGALDTRYSALGTGERREKALEDTATIIASVAPRFFKLVKARMARNLDVPDDLRELGESQIWVLHSLAKGRHQNSELARHYNVTDPTMSRIIDALVRKGYVERRPDMEDRRCTFLEITEQGTDLARHISDHFLKAVMQFLSPLTEEQLNDVLRAHKHLGSLLPETSQDLERELEAMEKATANRRDRGPRNPHREHGVRNYRRGRGSTAQSIRAFR